MGVLLNATVMKLPLIVLAWSTQAEAHEIEHVVVAMLENRAFDHMLGYYNRIDPRIDGLRGDECNVRNLTDPAAGKECVNDEALDHCPYDPDHSFGTLPPIQLGTLAMPLLLPLPLLALLLSSSVRSLVPAASTTERIFACQWGKTKGTPCVDMKMTNGSNGMRGFVASAVRRGQDGKNEMTAWPPEKVPIITTLASEYALFDRFFASHPGSTYPNRQFVLSATAHGMTDTGGAVPAGGFPQKTVLRSLHDAGLDWRLYYEDSLAWAIFLADVQANTSKPHIKQMSAFYDDTAAGTL